MVSSDDFFYIGEFNEAFSRSVELDTGQYLQHLEPGVQFRLHDTALMIYDLPFADVVNHSDVQLSGSPAGGEFAQAGHYH